MKVAILHLSDVHLKKGDNPVIAKFPAIRGVIEAHSADLDACVVVFSGDIAFSGKPAEYAVADDLIKQLRAMFSEMKMRFHLCFLPGNHDCDFEKADKTRELVLQGLLAGDADNIDESIVESCVRVQDTFFNFLGRQNGGDASKSCYDRLAYSSDFEVGGTRIRLNFFNTAWMSKKKDKQGEILLPVQRFDPTPSGYDAVIGVFHHPYAWLSTENRRAFRKYVEENSDIILTGHEHEGVAYTKEAFTGENTTHLEGGVLQDSQYKEISTFNLLVIDTTEKKFRVEQYEWKRDLYTRYLQSEWKPFIRGKLLLRNTFQISSSFLKDLNDPGAQFNHPRADRLILDDIFIAPDFRELLPPNVKRKTVRDLVSGTKVLSEIKLDPLHLITGAEKAGKTFSKTHLPKRPYARPSATLSIRSRDPKDEHRQGRRLY